MFQLTLINYCDNGLVRGILFRHFGGNGPIFYIKGSFESLLLILADQSTGYQLNFLRRFSRSNLIGSFWELSLVC